MPPLSGLTGCHPATHLAGLPIHYRTRRSDDTCNTGQLAAALPDVVTPLFLPEDGAMTITRPICRWIAGQLPPALMRHRENDRTLGRLTRECQEGYRMLPHIDQREVARSHATFELADRGSWVPGTVPLIGSDGLRTFGARATDWLPVSRTPALPREWPFSGCSPCWARDRFLVGHVACFKVVDERTEGRTPIHFILPSATVTRILRCPSSKLNAGTQRAGFGAGCAPRARRLQLPGSRRLRGGKTDRMVVMTMSGGAAAAVAAWEKEIGEQDGSCVHDRFNLLGGEPSRIWSVDDE